ncbi:hypothetical protein NX059_012238 [Plenodomus lindquistii]|nr:hypothetical protein NX059_012238 [Plenodomus lindquistii]
MERALRTCQIEMDAREHAGTPANLDEENGQIGRNKGPSNEEEEGGDDDKNEDSENKEEADKEDRDDDEEEGDMEARDRQVEVVNQHLKSQTGQPAAHVTLEWYERAQSFLGLDRIPLSTTRKDVALPSS